MFSRLLLLDGPYLAAAAQVSYAYAEQLSRGRNDARKESKDGDEVNGDDG